MKKLLIVLGSFTLVSGASLSVISCKTESKEYNQFRENIGHTQGTYDDYGNPLTKSSASVIYIGAKDNASSQSFEAALKNTFNNDMQEAVRDLSAPWETVNISNSIAFNASGAKLDQSNWSITGISDTKLNNLNKNATYVQVVFNEVKFDATFIQTTDETVSLKILGINNTNQEALIDAFNKATSASFPDQKYSSIKTYEIKDASLSVSNKSELYKQWTASYETTWLQQANADRGVTDVQMQLRGGSDYYGAILDQNSAKPTYGIKNNGEQGINAPITVGLDYAKPQLGFQYFNVDKISNYWNNDFFNKLASYLKEDILYQLGANEPNFDGSEANPKNQPKITARVKKADAILNKIKETKGPTFLFVKNGHFIDARKGWNQYEAFGGKDDMTENKYYSDLLSWAKEIGLVWSQSALDNLNSIASDGVKLLKSAPADDSGASNWDWEKNQPIEKEPPAENPPIEE